MLHSQFPTQKKIASNSTRCECVSQKATPLFVSFFAAPFSFSLLSFFFSTDKVKEVEKIKVNWFSEPQKILKLNK